MNNVLVELKEKTRFLRNSLNDDSEANMGKDKRKLWRCNSCDKLCGFKIFRITLNNGSKMWDMNVKELEFDV